MYHTADMPRAKRNETFLEAARRAVEQTIGEPLTTTPKKNMKFLELSRKGAAKGGEARAAALTPEKRRAIAAMAAKARWSKGCR